jgi:carboxylesterase type B
MTDECQARNELYVREYDPQKLIPGWQEEIAYLGVQSEHVRKVHPGRLDQPYGADDLQRLDLFVPEGVKRPPIQMFFHGGGWQGGDKATRAYPAKWFGAKGVVWASVNYRLAPRATLDEIVDDARHALQWIYENAGTFGGDRNRIFVTGNSAGGHLTGCLLMPGWKGDYGLPDDVIKGATTLSGVFDMRPVERSGVRSTVSARTTNNSSGTETSNRLLIFTKPEIDFFSDNRISRLWTGAIPTNRSASVFQRSSAENSRNSERE